MACKYDVISYLVMGAVFVLEGLRMLQQVKGGYGCSLRNIHLLPIVRSHAHRPICSGWSRSLLSPLLCTHMSNRRTSQYRYTSLLNYSLLGGAGCLQLLEIYWNLKTLLEIWNLIGPHGNFCVRCRRSTALVSSHKTGYQIAYLRNWSPCFIFAMAPCCIKCISYFCSISRQTTSIHYIRGRSKANVLDFS